MAICPGSKILYRTNAVIKFEAVDRTGVRPDDDYRYLFVDEEVNSDEFKPMRYFASSKSVLYNEFKSNMAYLFTSERLGFRMWEESDFSFFEEMNANPEVMKHFPSILTEEESRGWFEKMFEHYEKHGYVYFLVEQLSDQTPIGFIGMAYQDYESICTPAVDIGWRLIPSVWGKGYATEGATDVLNILLRH